MGIIVKNHRYHHFKRTAPPAPALKVEVSDEVPSKRKSALALIDSGADITCLSPEKIEELQKSLGYPLMVHLIPAFDPKTGQWMEVTTYAICTILEGEFQYNPDNGILPRVLPEEDMLIGRDIMEGLKITLDGINQTFTIED